MNDLIPMDAPPPATRQELEARAQAQLAPCRCGQAPRIGFIAQPGERPRTFRKDRIEAIIIRCPCGHTFQEPFDFDETMSGVYPSAAEKIMRAVVIWAKIQEFNLNGNATASIERKVVEAEARKLGVTAEVAWRLVFGPIQELTKRLIAPRG